MSGEDYPTRTVRGSRSTRLFKRGSSAARFWSRKDTPAAIEVGVTTRDRIRDAAERAGVSQGEYIEKLLDEHEEAAFWADLAKVTPAEYEAAARADGTWPDHDGLTPIRDDPAEVEPEWGHGLNYLYEYLDSEMTPEDERRFRGHLANLLPSLAGLSLEELVKRLVVGTSSVRQSSVTPPTVQSELSPDVEGLIEELVRSLERHRPLDQGEPETRSTQTGTVHDSSKG